MSDIDEKEIKLRFEAISQFKLSPEVTARDLERVRKMLTGQTSRQRTREQKMWRPITKLAAAAIVLIAAGFAAGRLSTPRPPDVEKLHAALQASLQPVISQSVLEQVNRDRQLALAKTYNQIRNEINQQLQQDLSKFGVQILTASGATTNQLLKELLISIGTVQLQDRYRIVAALEHIESNRLNDKNQLSRNLAGLAVLTRSELLQTKHDIAKMLSMKEPDKSIQDIPKLPIPKNERSKK
ncbi:MAG: BAR domain-containing protein [Planctomycetota bacterium]|jgi:hypothetical protein